MHFIINNQIGFTTDPSDSRSTRYCTDIAKSIEAPIFHVNGDDPEAVCMVSQLAVEFRASSSATCIDMYCYRMHGHNETDEPSFTQPLMYKLIAPIRRRNLHRTLIAEGVVTQADIDRKNSAGSRTSTPNSKPVRPTGRTRPTGWTDVGPVSSPPTRTSTMPAAPASASISCV